MDIPIRFIVIWTIVMTCTYTMSAYLYSEPNQSITGFGGQDYSNFSANDTDIKETVDKNADWWEILGDGLGKLWDGFVVLLEIVTFRVPHMPTVVTAGLNVIFVPLNIAYLIGIYPYIKEFVGLIVRIIDAIIPF